MPKHVRHQQHIIIFTEPIHYVVDIQQYYLASTIATMADVRRWMLCKNFMLAICMKNALATWLYAKTWREQYYVIGRWWCSRIPWIGRGSRMLCHRLQRWHQGHVCPMIHSDRASLLLICSCCKILHSSSSSPHPFYSNCWLECFRCILSLCILYIYSWGEKRPMPYEALYNIGLFSFFRYIYILECNIERVYSTFKMRHVIEKTNTIIWAIYTWLIMIPSDSLFRHAHIVGMIIIRIIRTSILITCRHFPIYTFEQWKEEEKEEKRV